MLKTLRNRFILTNMALVGALLIIVLIVFCVNTYDLQMKEIDRTLQAPLTSGDYDEGQFGFLTSVVALTDSDGNVQQMYTRGATLSNRELKYAVSESLNHDSDKGMLKGTQELVYQKTYLSNGDIIVVFADASHMLSVIYRTIFMSVIVFLAAMIVVFLISRYIAKQAISPIQQTWDRQKQFIANASHELKTPITVILANGGILKNRQNSTILQESQWIDSTIEEAGHMKKLVEEMLFLARNDSTEMALNREKVDMTELVETDMLNFEPLAYEKGIELKGKIKEGIVMEADPMQMKQLIHILMDNAIKYAGPPELQKSPSCVAEGSENATMKKPCAEVEISLSEGPVLSVKNTGRPISEKDLPHLFERFYRADSARTRHEDSTGYGLGLAIAKTIVEMHRGEISVVSNENAGPKGLNGTEFIVKFESVKKSL